MKKFLMALALVLGLSTAAQARDSYSRDVNTLPAAAQTVLQKNFKAGVSLIKIDKTLGMMVDDYEVILTDGTEIDFDSKGNWKNVETPKNKAVPSSLFPEAISTYVAKNHKGQKIVGIDKNRNNYEVELSNGIDLLFDLSGNFQRFD